MDKKAIETISVNAVKNSIVTSDILDQFISENDKEPSWDGHIYIYKNKNKRKSELKGRIPVQVKGKECNDFSNNKIKYVISISDLKNYLNDGGIILFVVYIRNNGTESKIYYSSLPPIKLKNILEKISDNQKNKSVELQAFPTDNESKANICLNCLQHCQMQASFANSKLYSIEEIKQQNILEGISIPISFVSTSDAQSVLIDNEAYIYANVKGCPIPQPLKDIPMNMHIMEEIQANISVNFKRYYSEFRIIKSATDTVFIIGESFRMTFIGNEKYCKIGYQNSSNLRILVKDLAFMLAYLETGCFKINDYEIPLDKGTINKERFNVSAQKKHLDFFIKVVKMLDILGCSDDLNLNNLTNDDWCNIRSLITALIDKKPVKGLKENLYPIQNFKVGKLNFLMVIFQHPEEATTYDVYDFFKKEIRIAYDCEYGEKLPISQFILLDKEALLKVSNVDFDALLPSFQCVEQHDDTINRANFFLLELLAAYDLSNDTRKEILKAALDFAEWIYQSDEHTLSRETKELNLLQTIKRERELKKEERQILYSIIETQANSEEVLVGAYLLLDQQEAAEIHFAKLSSQAQNEFKNFPIFRFWNNKI